MTGMARDFHGQTRNDTHRSTTDPDSRLYRKAAGREARLCYMGHVVMENRHGLADRPAEQGHRHSRKACIRGDARDRDAGWPAGRMTVARTRPTTQPIMWPVLAAGIMLHVTQNNGGG